MVVRDLNIGDTFVDGGNTFIVDDKINGQVFSHLVENVPVNKVVVETKKPLTEEKPAAKPAPKKTTTTKKTTKK